LPNFAYNIFIFSHLFTQFSYNFCFTSWAQAKKKMTETNRLVLVMKLHQHRTEMSYFRVLNVLAPFSWECESCHFPRLMSYTLLIW
jgi:hypothetical protein